MNAGNLAAFWWGMCFVLGAIFIMILAGWFLEVREWFDNVNQLIKDKEDNKLTPGVK